ncbi:MAG: hypothetical protein MAG715_01162 [Methanonatronarchaeales archaeon]|nr:hypothetical protein [Methanonatronarchaeales archaeon]
MRVDLSIELKDVPGELLRALEPLSEAGANIVSVVHHREKRTARGTLPVEVEIEVEENRLERLLDDLRTSGVQIINVGHNRLRERLSVVLIGHVLHTGLQDTVDRIDSTGYAEVVDLAMEMPEVNGRSAARLGIRTVSEKSSRDVLMLLDRVSEEKDLILVKDVGAPA